MIKDSAQNPGEHGEPRVKSTFKSKQPIIEEVDSAHEQTAYKQRHNQQDFYLDWMEAPDHCEQQLLLYHMSLFSLKSLMEFKSENKGGSNHQMSNIGSSTRVLSFPA